MSNLLYVECSPRKQRSASIEVAKAFIDAYVAARPSDIVETIDVWDLDLPEFDGAAMEAKYAGLSGAHSQGRAFGTIGGPSRRKKRCRAPASSLQLRAG